MTLLEESLQTLPVRDDFIAVPMPRTDPDDDSKAWTRRARPESPVGRISARLAIDPTFNHPLRQLERRLGRPLLDLSTVTDGELAELCGLLLAERIRRDGRWLS